MHAGVYMYCWCFLVIYVFVMYGYCWLTKLFLQQDAERTKWSKNRPESSRQSSQGYHLSCLRDEWSGPGWEFGSLTAEEQHSEGRGGNSAGHIARVSSSPVTCAATMQLLASCPLLKNNNKRHTSDVLNLSMVYMCEAQNAVHVELKVRTVWRNKPGSGERV